MPIHIQVGEDDLWAPITICDRCGEQIEDAREGNYSWQVSREGKPVDGRIYFAHKKCCRVLEARMAATGQHTDSMHWFWEELARFPLYLCTNLSLKTSDLKP